MKKLFSSGIFALMFLVSCSENDLFPVTEDMSIAEVSPATRSSSTYSLSSIVSTISLSATDQSSVNKILNELQSEPLGKGYKPVFKKIATKKVSSISRGNTGTAEASYNPATDAISLKTGSDIAATQIQEEFIHAAQDMTYSNGISQYAGKTGTPNIEFEAKIIQELIYCANGYGFGGLGSGPTHADEYSRWIVLLCEDGLFDEKFPSMSEVLNTKYSNYGYYDFMGFFKTKSPSYNYSIINGLQPIFLDYVNKNYGL